ncbi:hypothetical protein BCL80_12710 [Streptomyces avidinii]|nr:hypothetical protein BCL80_12710 [Streptomyces avidinii]SNX81261.1 hypothetical protein SAMN05421860_1277 [Streptomyces microflavus]
MQCGTPNKWQRLGELAVKVAIEVAGTVIGGCILYALFGQI